MAQRGKMEKQTPSDSRRMALIAIGSAIIAVAITHGGTVLLAIGFS